MSDSTDWFSSTESILTNLGKSLEPIERLLTGAGYLIGRTFAIKGIMTLKSHGEQRSSMSGTGNMKEAGVYLLASAMLLYFPTALQALLNSTFGYSNILAYSSGTAAAGWVGSVFGTDSQVGPVLTMIVQIIGLIAFIRGWILIARASGQGQTPGGTGKGMMHVFGGILAMNIIGTMQVFYNTLFGSS